jgi:hypothetical protein
VSFSPDKYPENPRSGVVGFVVFAEQEQRDAAITADKASYALMGSEFQIGTRIIRCEQKDPERNLALDRLEKDTMAQAIGKETAEQQVARRKVQRQGAWQGGGMTITDEEGTVLKRDGEAALKQMQEQTNKDLTAALAVKVNQLFASFNQKFEASRREETRKTDEAIRLVQEENAALRRQMLAMEAARLERDRKMGTVLEGIIGPKLGDLHWREATRMGQKSRVLPAEAAGMLEAARHAKRLRDHGWMGGRGQGRWPAQRLLEWAVKELTLSRRGVEMELGGLEDWLERERMKRKMSDSLLKWLGHDRPPSVRASHKVWRKQLVNRTRQLKLGADRARQQSDMLLLDGTDIVVEAESVAEREPAQAEAEPDPAVEEGASDAEEWEDRGMGDWIAGTGADPEDAEAGIGADAEAEAGARAEEAAPEGCEAAGRGGEEAAAAGLEAPAEVLEQMLQVCVQCDSRSQQQHCRPWTYWLIIACQLSPERGTGCSLY